MIAPVVGLPLLLGSSRSMNAVVRNVLWLMRSPGLKPR